MIVSIGMTAESHRKIARDSRLADQVDVVMGKAMNTAAFAGAEDVRRQLVMGQLDIDIRNPASGLGASVFGWMLDDQAPVGAIGVPSNSPAAAYARILNDGGTIYPKNARALAVPVSDEAKRFSSPRDMDNLTMIPRKGKPPLLVEKLSARGRRRANWIIHWVLVGSVTIAPRRWLSRGVEAARGLIAGSMSFSMNEYVNAW